MAERGGIHIEPTSLQQTLRALDALGSKKNDGLVKRAGIKASNVVGKKARDDVSMILASIAGAKRSAIKPRSKAASKYQAAPAYKLEYPRSIPISALASLDYDKSAGTVEFKTLAGKMVQFNARRGRGRGAKFKLPRRGPLPERSIGGLVFTRDARTPEVERYARSRAPALASAFESEMETLLARFRR